MQKWNMDMVRTLIFWLLSEIGNPSTLSESLAGYCSLGEIPSSPSAAPAYTRGAAEPQPRAGGDRRQHPGSLCCNSLDMGAVSVQAELINPHTHTSPKPSRCTESHYLTIWLNWTEEQCLAMSHVQHRVPYMCTPYTRTDQRQWSPSHISH